MLYLFIKAAISGAIVAAVSEIARRYPGWGGLVASLPLTSLLARFEHRAKACTSRTIRENGSVSAIDYKCGAAGFGESEVTLLTPRSLRISTQGISDGLPFNYVLQARRVGDCAKSASSSRH